MNNLRKINIASYRVLKTLLLLFEKNMTMNELVEALDADGSGTYNNFVVSKYVHTCKSCGLDIQKIDGKYCLVNFPFAVKFTPDETRLLFELQNNNQDLKSKTQDKNMQTLLEKLHLPFFKSSVGFKSSENYLIVKVFEKAMTAESDVLLTFKDGTQKQCTPADIVMDGDKIVLKVTSDNGVEDVYPDKLANVKPTNKSARKTKISGGEVVYELKGKLAKRYQLRENEQILKFKANGTIVITNKYEDKKTLLHRLMRYDALCKIVKPQEYVDDFKKMINDALDNYGL